MHSTTATFAPLFAHRGSLLEAPENTLASFRRALAYDIAGLELDVHLSRDGEVIVMHDYRVDRTTDGRGWIKDFTLSELKALDAGSWFHPRFHGETVPTLGEVCELVRGTTVALNIELKNNLIAYDGLEAKVLQLIDDFNYWDRVVLSSFNHNSLYKIRQFHRSVQTGILYSHRLFKPWAYARELGATALHPEYRRLDEQTVKKAHASGLAVNSYTVNERSHMKRLFTWGVNHVITDNLPRFARLINDSPS